MMDDPGIQHDGKEGTVAKGNDSFPFADHIGCQKGAVNPIGFQRIQ